MAFGLLDLDFWLPCPDTAALFFRALLSTGDKTDVLPELRSLKAEYRTPIHVTDSKEVDDIAPAEALEIVIGEAAAAQHVAEPVQIDYGVEFFRCLLGAEGAVQIRPDAHVPRRAGKCAHVQDVIGKPLEVASGRLRRGGAADPPGHDHPRVT